MDPEFIAILQKLIAEQGRETLLNSVKCKAFLADYTRNEYKKESRLLLQALDAGVQKAIDKAENITICKKQQIRALSEEYSLAEERAVEVVDTLALVLRGDKSKTEIRKEEPKTEKAKRKPRAVAVNSQQPVPKNNVSPKIGSIIPFGSYDWLVLDVQGDEALIITENVIEKRLYNEKYKTVPWETCDLREYLNNEFLLEFRKEQQRRIIEKRIPNPDNLWYGTKGGGDTHDKVFLLSLEEVDRYFGDSGDYLNKRRKYFKYDEKYFVIRNDECFSNSHDGARVASYEDEACWWWLRSSGLFDVSVAFVHVDGCVHVAGHSTRNGGGVRPALWLKV